MKREERIAEARIRGAASAESRAAQEEERAKQIHDRLVRVGPEEAQRRVSAAQLGRGTRYVGPIKTPGDWDRAVEIARDVTIEAARNRRTITYGELRYAVLDELDALVGWSMFGQLAMRVNVESDGVLLSAIIVHQSDGKPGDGFIPYARSQGFDGEVATLQRHVFDHFSPS